MGPRSGGDCGIPVWFQATKVVAAMNRPLSKKKIDELESLFEDWRRSPDQLRVLLDELTHHKRRRGAALRAKVKAALKRAGARAKPVPSLKQMELPFDS